jgi:hypothetical protein
LLYKLINLRSILDIVHNPDKVVYLLISDDVSGSLVVYTLNFRLIESISTLLYLSITRHSKHNPDVCTLEYDINYIYNHYNKWLVVKMR